MRCLRTLAFAAALALPQASASAAPTEYEFPPKLFEATVPCPGWGDRKVPVLNDLEVRWYSRHWRAAAEPALYPAATQPGEATYRFTWLRSFDHPIIVRIEAAADGKMEIAATELSGAGGYAPGRVMRRLHRRLTDRERSRVLALVSQPELFAGPGSECDTGMDGAEWIVEARDDQAYRFVKAWSPDAGSVHDLGLALLRLTRWELDPIY